MKFSLAQPNPGKRSTENFTKISRQISRHLWQRKTEKNFTSALLQGSCSEKHMQSKESRNRKRTMLIGCSPCTQEVKNCIARFVNKMPNVSARRSCSRSDAPIALLVSLGAFGSVTLCLMEPNILCPHTYSVEPRFSTRCRCLILPTRYRKNGHLRGRGPKWPSPCIAWETGI